MTQPGDLGRRIARRRVELGINVEDLAQRAGIDPVYLKYVEHDAGARLSSGALNLLALALDTNPIDLQGGEVDRAPGTGRARRDPTLEILTKEQCEAHLGAGGVGRLVFTNDRGPVAVPMNFAFCEGQIVLSTDFRKATLVEALSVVGFEVDRVDDALSEGWSVLMSGTARVVDDPEELLRLSFLDLQTWAGGDRHVLICITPSHITGRVIIHDSTAEEG